MRISDWRSDVCSSDLGEPAEQPVQLRQPIVDVADALVGGLDDLPHQMIQLLAHLAAVARDLVAEVQQADMLEVEEAVVLVLALGGDVRSEEHTSELQSLMRISYAVFCLKKKNTIKKKNKQ